MIWIFSLIAITSIWVLGLTIVTQPGMGLYAVREWADKKKVPVYEAIILCPWCMPSIHSVIGYVFCIATGVIDFEWKMAIAYPIIVCGASVVSGLTWTIYVMIDTKRKYYTNVEQLTYFDIKDRKGNFQRNNKNN